MSDDPELSIVLAGEDLDETAHVRALYRRQSVARRLELVLVLPATRGDSEVPDDLFRELWGGRIVRFDFTSRGEGNAAGVRAARAPIVVLGEDHCYPGGDWAEALLRDHRGPWVAVGPQLRNANPGSHTSWADFVIGYGPWSRAEQAGEAPFLPGHNTSYKRAALLAYGERLEPMLESETTLHWDLVGQGHRLLLSRTVVVRHLNFSQPAAFARSSYLNGRNFGAVRARGWSPARRLAYALASPLIPWVRAWRLRSCFGARKDGGAPWRSLPALFLGLYLDAAGQALGYLTLSAGPKEALRRLEFRRTRFVRPADLGASSRQVDAPS